MTGPDEIVCVLFRPKRKKDRNYNQNFKCEVKSCLLVFEPQM